MSIITTDVTSAFVESYIKQPSHALLLTGASGAGLKTLAVYLAGQAGTLHRLVEPVQKTARAKAGIDTERIRELYNDTRTKLDGAHFVIIDDADRMNPTAQNALLKLLEEPSESIHFILTSHVPEALLPTVRSRVWTFNVGEIDSMASRRLLKSRGITDATKLTQMLYIADGLPAQLVRLSSNEAEFETAAGAIRSARSFIEGSTYDRLVIANGLKDDREAALRFIATTTMLLQRAVSSSDTPKPKLQLIDALLKAHDAINTNGNVRLQLIAAMV